tara:strand:+ start:1805 stop:3061 length:1257 start_codon:yes stop_codon:yes gene_type:complete
MQHIVKIITIRVKKVRKINKNCYYSIIHMNINNKGENMINLKKLGLTALAGSLVAVSAQAGEMSVTGSANVTYKEGNGAVADSFGTDKDVAFTGTGELDNGWTFTVSTLLDDAYAVSSSYTSLTMGDMGTVSFGADTGGASYKYDEEVPQSYEQTSDGQQNSANIVGNRMDSNMIVYNSPSFDLGVASASFDFEWSKSANGTAANDGGTATDNDASTNIADQFGQGLGLGVTINAGDLAIGVYGAERENITKPAAANNAGSSITGASTAMSDFQGVWYAKYAYGPVAVGYSHSYHDSGLNLASAAHTAAKTVGEVAGIFDAETYSIAYNVNDNLSVSYTETTDTYDAQSGDRGATSGAGLVGAQAIHNDVDQKTSAIQAAYSMGAASIKFYSMKTDNPGYDSDALEQRTNEIALGLAF